MTAPDVTETTRGSSAPGAVSELTMALPDKCVARAITGPSKATQMTPAPARATAPDTEWMAQGAPLSRPRPGRSGSRRRSAAAQGTPPAATAWSGAQLTLDGGRDGAGAAEGGRRKQREPTLLVLSQARL